MHVRQRLGASERHACRVLGQPRTTQRRVRKGRRDEAALRTDVVRLASRFGRYGYRQITNLLRIEGWQVNHKLVRRWLARLGVQTLFIEPGSPWENGYNESFNGKLRNEFLNGEIFYTLPEAVVLIEQWRRLYNTVRPHSAYGGRPPAPETVKPADWFLRMPQLLGPQLAQGLT